MAVTAQGPETITVAGEPMLQPLELIVGYAFAEVIPGPDWSPPERHALEPKTARPRWGYRTYDCIPTSPGPELAGVDLVIAAGLNGDLTVGRVGAIKAAAPQVSEHLASLEGSPPFWELPPEEVDEPVEGSMGHHLGAAWELLMRQPDLGVAITHKTLHHKRPHLFPLLDNRTVTQLAEGHAWRAIHDDLTGQREQWASLERAFTNLIRNDEEVTLTRLRLHDILLWLRASGPDEVEQARSAGKDFLTHWR